MARNERGNVCGSKTEELTDQGSSVVAPKAISTSKAGSAAAKSQAHTKRKYKHRHSAQPNQTFEPPFRLFRNPSQPAGAR